MEAASRTPESSKHVRAHDLAGVATALTTKTLAVAPDSFKYLTNLSAFVGGLRGPQLATGTPTCHTGVKRRRLRSTSPHSADPNNQTPPGNGTGRIEVSVISSPVNVRI